MASTAKKRCGREEDDDGKKGVSSWSRPVAEGTCDHEKADIAARGCVSFERRCVFVRVFVGRTNALSFFPQMAP